MEELLEGAKIGVDIERVRWVEVSINITKRCSERKRGLSNANQNVDDMGVP